MSGCCSGRIEPTDNQGNTYGSVKEGTSARYLLDFTDTEDTASLTPAALTAVRFTLIEKETRLPINGRLNEDVKSDVTDNGDGTVTLEVKIPAADNIFTNPNSDQTEIHIVIVDYEWNDADLEPQANSDEAEFTLCKMTAPVIATP